MSTQSQSKLSRTVFAALASFAFWHSTTAFAESTAEFFGSLQGDFRGRGTAVPESGANPIRISCKISTEYSDEGQTLTISGDCASTQGKAKVSGELAHLDGKISGSFISPFSGMEMTSSSGTFGEGTLKVISNFVHNETGELRRVRQVVEREGDGFKAVFFSFEKSKQKFKEAGSIVFSREQSE